MEVQELAPGLWRWTAPHPEWEPHPEPESPADWPQEVGCIYYEAPNAVVLIDPLVPPPPERERFFAALDRDVERRGHPVSILLTVSWHDRSVDEVAARYDALRTVPDGVVALPVEGANETLYWLPEHGALVPGDVLIGDEGGGIRLCPDSWLPGETDPAVLRGQLRTLLDLPVERVLVSHGEPVLDGARAALERSLGA
jgi:hypothetical protein